MSHDYHHSPYPSSVGLFSVPGHEVFVYYGQMQHTVEYVAISYRLTLRGVTPVQAVPSWRDASLPDDSVRVTLADHQVVLTVDEWGGHEPELDAWLRDWIIKRVDWSKAGVAGGRSRRDPGWMRVLRERGPWR